MLRRYQIVVAACIMAVAGFAATSVAQELAFELDPAQSHVDFLLADVVHTVHGDFHLKNGFLRFDAQNGGASGQLTVDATTGESGSKGRDRKMHQQVLESATYPDITFQPQHVIGKIPGAGASQLEIQGLMTMHGQTHAMTATGAVQINGDQVSADLRFVVPYQQWGMKNPSVLLLRVSDKVEITVHAVGRLMPVAPSSAAQSGASTH
ncbi:MAG: YceI family protein [Terriglobales bacterium]|jgi:polyisoprenoid-binding protein YceI